MNTAGVSVHRCLRMCTFVPMFLGSRLKHSSAAIVLMLVIAACGGGESASELDPLDVSETSAAVRSGSDVPSATERGVPAADDPATLGSTAATVDPNADATSSDPNSHLPVVPDFTLALGDGSTFTLSEASKPVYLVFWAEW